MHTPNQLRERENMTWFDIIWTDDIEEHIAEHDLTLEDVREVLENAESHSTSRSSGLPCAFGYTPDGRYIIVIYEEEDNGITIIPKTAYEV